jgi:hypothetical protein
MDVKNIKGLEEMDVVDSKVLSHYLPWEIEEN